MPMRPVVKLDVPATAIPPADCVMAPPVLEVPAVTLRLPPTLPEPSTKLSVERAVRVPPIFSALSVRLFLSVSETLFAPVLARLTAPRKLLLARVSVTAPAPASIDTSPVPVRISPV